MRLKLNLPSAHLQTCKDTVSLSRCYCCSNTILPLFPTEINPACKPCFIYVKKNDDLVGLACPRCVCIIEGSAVTDMPRIQAVPGGLVCMSRVRLSVASTRDTGAISARTGDRRPRENMVDKPFYDSNQCRITLDGYLGGVRLYVSDSGLTRLIFRFCLKFRHFLKFSEGQIVSSTYLSWLAK